MMNDNNLPIHICENEPEGKTKSVNLDITSQTINKAIDLVADSTKQTRTSLDANTSKGMNKFIELLKSTPLGIKIDTYIAERPYKLEKALTEMKAKYNKTPDCDRKEPSSYIALKVANNINYCLDEDHMRHMFINLLVSDMNKQKSPNVLPTFIDMINQLSPDDAIFLKKLKDNGYIGNLPILRIKSVDENSYFEYVSPYILCIKELDYMEISQLVLDNLLKLQIVDILTGFFVPKISNYEEAFSIKKNCYINTKSKIDYTPTKLIFTDLGKKFIDICLS